MWCCSTLKAAKNFTFSNKSLQLSDAVVTEYACLKKQFLLCKSQLESYKINTNECIPVLKNCLRLYKSSEKILGALLSEIFKPNVDLRHKRRALEVLNKMVYMFYYIDIIRFNHVAVFHDFAILKQSGEVELKEYEAMVLNSFASISMPFAHLFISSFKAGNIELYCPNILTEKNAIHIDKTRKNHMYYLCAILVYTEMDFLLVFLCAAYNKFFRANIFKDRRKVVNERLKAYYNEMLTF